MSSTHCHREFGPLQCTHRRRNAVRLLTPLAHVSYNLCSSFQSGTVSRKYLVPQGSALFNQHYRRFLQPGRQRSTRRATETTLWPILQGLWWRWNRRWTNLYGSLSLSWSYQVTRLSSVTIIPTLSFPNLCLQLSKTSLGKSGSRATSHSRRILWRVALPGARIFGGPTATPWPNGRRSKGTIGQGTLGNVGSKWVQTSGTLLHGKIFPVPVLPL